MPTLTAIHLHPVKSCRRIEVDRAEVGERGLVGDREWQVTGADGAAVTQRQHPHLATVSPSLSGDTLVLDAPGRATIEAERPAAVDSDARTVLGERIRVGDAGDDVAAWFTDLLGVECRLSAIAPGFERRLRMFDQDLSLADAAPVVVAGAASLADLVRRASEPFGMERFRPNLVVGGAEPWAEDTWQRFEIGAAALELGMPWPRCAIPQVDQQTAERHREPARVLKAHRWCSEAPGWPEALQAALANQPLFAVGCSIGPPGTVIAVGDPVTVIETAPPLLPPPT